VLAGTRAPAAGGGDLADVTSRVAEPSLTRLEMPAVTFPSISPKRSVRSASAKAGRRPANASTVDPGLMVSSASSCPALANAMTTQARKLLDQAKTANGTRSSSGPDGRRIRTDSGLRTGRGRSAARAGAGGGNRPARGGASRSRAHSRRGQDVRRGLEFGGPIEDDTCSLLWRFVSSGD
jgi:hypothetical protein